nr:regulator of nonsense transcripts UPF2 [Ipomoea batatas]
MGPSLRLLLTTSNEICFLSRDAGRRLVRRLIIANYILTCDFQRRLMRLRMIRKELLNANDKVEFCYVNSKSNRKKLVRALFNVPRTSLELLPYYSRMVATLSTCMKDVSSMLLQLLEEEFNNLINKKDQMNIESKIRNIRFIGELCKFKIAPAGRSEQLCKWLHYSRNSLLKLPALVGQIKRHRGSKFPSTQTMTHLLAVHFQALLPALRAKPRLITAASLAPLETSPDSQPYFIHPAAA